MAGDQPRRGTVERAPNTGKRAGGPTWVAVDTGGTFTDVIAWRPEGLRTLKLPSTPDDPSRAILEGIRRIVDDGDARVLLHGSTVATNALLEGRGARVALIANRGFEDVLEIGRQNRPQLYALVGHRPPPLVPSDRRLGITGRRDADGSELTPLDPDELGDLADRVRATGAEAVAVCLLHSYADGEHERQVGEALGSLGLPLSLSSELLPEYREYERTSTTVINAYVAPLMSRYLRRLEAEAGAVRVAVMGSNGGTLAVDRAAREPAHTVLSGPAGGVVGALEWARRAGHPSILTFDMGGTSTDVSLCPGRPLHTREFEIDGRPVALPVLDIHTVGAGGGSIARVDAGGALRVGPESAGAVPGPICYGRGGQEVTVTDAHLWLGRIPDDAFLGGESTLDRTAVEGPLSDLADQLGTSLDAAADGVLAVADAAMERALRVISVERGFDPRDFALVAFGGAGALHAAELASRLGCTRALIPPDPGLLSAWGILTAPLRRQLSRTLLAATDATATDHRISDARDILSADAATALVEDGADPESISLVREIDARYRGQSFELRVGAEEGDDWAEAFHAAHESRYGYRRDGAVVEAVTVRVTATAPGAPVVSAEVAAATAPPPTRERQVVVRGERLHATSVWRRDLGPGHRVDGPALVLDYSATTWVPPLWRVEVDEIGVLHLLRTGDLDDTVTIRTPRLP